MGNSIRDSLKRITQNIRKSGIVRETKNIIKNVSMKKKMTIAFAVPIVIAYLVLDSVCNHYITREYGEKLKFSAEQSNEQALLSLNSYVIRMYNLQDRITQDKAINDVLTSEISEDSYVMGALYRRLLLLQQSLIEYEMLNVGFRVEMFVPEGFLYESDKVYLHEYNTLEQMEDYEALEKALDQGESFWSLDTIKKSASSGEMLDVISVYSGIQAYDYSTQRVAVLRISVERDLIVQVLQNAGMFEESRTYLMNDRNMVLADDGKEQVLNWKEMQFPQKNTMWEEIEISQKEYFLLNSRMDDVEWSLVSLIPKKEYEQEQNFSRIFRIIMASGIIIVVAVLAHLLSRYYVKRLIDLNRKMEILQSGDLSARLPVDRETSGDEIDEVYKNFNFMAEEVKRLMQEHYRLGKEVRVSELRALQAQINPHFLYNTLDLINWMAVDYGAPEISNIIWDLSRFYRLSLNKGRSILTIREELEHVRVYVNIENVHFNGAISYREEVPRECRELACLNIVLQPFVENAIVHGMRDHPEIDWIHITLTAEMKDGDIIFHVADDGAGINREAIRDIEEDYMKASQKGYGIRNINFRLKLCYGEEYGVSYEKNLERGTIAHIRIPQTLMDEAEKRRKHNKCS